jgi:hypothetical protein
LITLFDKRLIVRAPVYSGAFFYSSEIVVHKQNKAARDCPGRFIDISYSLLLSVLLLQYEVDHLVVAAAAQVQQIHAVG